MPHLVVTPVALARWRFAVFATFMASGMSVATWAARLPDIKLATGIDNAQLGMLLLGMGAASITGIALSPRIGTRFGPRRGLPGLIITFALGIAVIGLGTVSGGAVWLVALGMLLFGFGNGAADVMMNVDAALIEQRSGRTLMPLFHAFFSLGTVLGAGIGWVAAAARVPFAVHGLAVAAVLIALGLIVLRHIPRREPDSPPAAGAPETFSAWREPRTYLLGLVVLGITFAEGGANDWLALGMSEGHGEGAAAGAGALTVFLVCMTLVRVVSGPLVDRIGRVLVLRVLATVAVCGILLFVFSPSLPLSYLGAALWGMGVAVGFPLGMSAAADDPVRAAARVSAVAAIGYIAFLAGPPVLGLISESVGLLNTLLILAALVAVSGLASGAARPLPPR